MSELSEFLSAYFFVCKRELTEFLAELTEFAVELSEFSLPKQYSRNSIPPVSLISDFEKKKHRYSYGSQFCGNYSPHRQDYRPDFAHVSNKLVRRFTQRMDLRERSGVTCVNLHFRSVSVTCANLCF